jgi:uncharacterized protein with HEPN domain
MPLERDPATLLDMVIAGRRIQEFITGQDFAEFSADLKTQSAVILQILILREGARRLSEGLKHTGRRELHIVESGLRFSTH